MQGLCKCRVAPDELLQTMNMECFNSCTTYVLDQTSQPH
jgi:hypothetical protein